MTEPNGPLEAHIPNRWDMKADCSTIDCIESPAPFFFSAEKDGVEIDFQICQTCHQKLTIDHEPITIQVGENEMTLQFTPTAKSKERPPRKVAPDE